MPAHFLRVFRQHVVRDVVRHPLLAALNILSVALGVAVYLAIQIANQSANRAFASTIDLVAGKAHLQITAPGGDLPEPVLPEVRRLTGISAATPLVRGVLTLPDFPGEYLQVLGVDVFTNEPFRTFDLTGIKSGSFDVQQWLGAPDVIAVTAEFATAHNLRASDSIRVQVNGNERILRVGFVMRAEGAAALDSHFAAMDIGWAQELFGRRGVLSEIQLRVDRHPAREQIAAEVRKLLPATAVVAAPAQRGSEVEKMLDGFQLNLTAMSLVSLLVGVFLIYNTISGSVVRRRREIGILRSLGITRNEVRALFLGEAILLALPGIIVGLGAGFLLARGLIGPVSRTISSLYVLISVRSTTIPLWTVLSAAAIGLVSVIAGAWVPAHHAAQAQPARALHAGGPVEQSEPLSTMWLALGGLSLLLALALSFLALSIGPPWLGFGAAFFVLGGFSLGAAPMTAAFSDSGLRVVRWLRARTREQLLETGLAIANLRRSLWRNSVTIAALAAAVAMGVGVSVMVFSFRQTIGNWIRQTLTADLFVGPVSNEISGLSSFMPAAAVAFLSSHPAVESIDSFREIELPFRGQTIAVAIVGGNDRRRLQFLHGDSAAKMRRFNTEQCVVLSESFAQRYRLRDGETLELPTPEGLKPFVIAGTFYDYTRDQGVVYLSSANFLHFWKDSRVNSVAVYLKANGSGDELIAGFRNRFSRAGEFAIYRNRDLRVRVFEIFDQTFAVTYVLRSIAVIVAVVGIFLTLTTLVTERSRELAVIRAIGGSRAQIRALLLWEAAFIGLVSSLIGILSGLCLSTVLTGVINRAFFGWTIHLAFPWSSLASTPFWIVGAAVAAGLIPAWRAGQLVLAEALRSE